MSANYSWQARQLLRRYGLRPRKGLGQNFLEDPGALDKVVAAADIQPPDVILEVGPGLGGLTRLLAGRARRVVAVELDQRLFPALEEVLQPYPNVSLVEGDILALDPGALVDDSDYLVVANIPYYITSPLIRHLLEAEYKPRRLVLTVQREVAERICASPGRLSLLALSVQVYGAPRIVARLPARAFYPRPKVDSNVVRVDVYPRPLIPKDQIEAFFQLARAGYSQRRKTLRNALAGGLAWPKDRAAELLLATGVDPDRRAETLSLEEWRDLTERFTNL